MFTGKDKPKGEQTRVEDALADVAEEQHEGHVEDEREVLEREVQEGEGAT